MATIILVKTVKMETKLIFTRIIVFLTKIQNIKIDISIYQPAILFSLAKINFERREYQFTNVENAV